MTAEQINKLAAQAYRDLGYEVFTFRDGSQGVTRCPPKTIRLMNRFQELLYDVLEAEMLETSPDQSVAAADTRTPSDDRSEDNSR